MNEDDTKDCPQYTQGHCRSPICQRCRFAMWCDPFRASIKDRRGIQNPFWFGQAG